jgi:hypothetical protein
MVGSAKAAKFRNRFCYLVAIVLLYGGIAGNVTAQVRFVQITDPHLFDKTEAEMSKNKQALVDAIWEINKLQSANGVYDFVVVTGDIGVEEIVKNVFAAEERNIKIDKSAKMMAGLMAISEVKQWLFVPGNNDLEDEMPNSIEHYHRFIETLRVTLLPLGIMVTDLCPTTPPKFPYIVRNEYAFIGFNNAGFKNNNDSSRLSKKIEPCCKAKAPCSAATMIRCLEDREIERVSALVETGGKPAYIFYHIPEVDDPYLLRNDTDPPDWKLRDFHRNRHASQAVTGSDYLNSSWFVDEKLRSRWQSIVQSPKVKGLFAGHLHDPHPELYESYPDQSHPKLYVCPPLAMKLQADSNPQARGFREVSIDRSGNVIQAIRSDGAKTNGPPIYWYDKDKWLFATAKPLETTPTLPAIIPTQSSANGGSMSWEKAAHISTVLQFLVVVVSVFFIRKQLQNQAEQLKQQTNLARVANTQALVSLAFPFNLELAKNKDLASLWLRGTQNWDELNNLEKDRYGSLLRWRFTFYENIFFQAKSGLLDKSINLCWNVDLDSFIEFHPVEKYWSEMEKKYTQEFADYINARIEIKHKKVNGSAS